MNDHPLKVEHHKTTLVGGSIASKDYEDRYFQDNGFDVELQYSIRGTDDPPVAVEFFLSRTR